LLQETLTAMPHGNRPRCLAILAGAALLLSAQARATPLPPALDGWWLDQTGRAGIRFERCKGNDTLICGSVQWLLHPMAKAGGPEVDALNKDESLRGRHVCGMAMLGGFVADGPNHWSDGWIYNPDDGDTYRSVMALADDGTLHVRGYVGISLFGKSEVWTRPKSSLMPCS
jgi:uncharacterized protein (DUF2147 family)